MNTKIIIIYVVAIAFTACQADKSGDKRNPNLIYILTDQWRSSALGYAGDPNVKTPALDEFSSNAVIFKNAISVCPLCTPHRASLLTGKFPTTTGMFLNDLYLPSEELCMAEIYKEAGYSTAYYGKWHLDGHGRLNNVEADRRQGFDYWKALECSHQYDSMPYYENDDPELKYWNGYSPFAIIKDVESYLEIVSAEKNPFLLFIALGTPHFPHHKALKKYLDMYPQENLTLRENVQEDKQPQVRKELQGYYAHCTATDKVIGDLLDKLKDLNLYKNSIIVFTSDHGEMMGSHGIRPKEKSVAYDESIKVPFLISYPDIKKNRGKENFTPLNTPDILPSLLSLSGIEIPSGLEGEDLSSIVLNPDEEIDRPALFMMVYANTVTPITEYRGIRTKQYTYSRSIDQEVLLFDNYADPYQINNLAGNPEAKELQEKMDKLLKEELSAVGDDNFKNRYYYSQKWGYGDGKSIPYNVTPGKISKVFSPRR